MKLTNARLELAVKISTTFILILFFSGCSHEVVQPSKEPTPLEKIRNSINQSITQTYVDTQGISVFFATNRSVSSEIHGCSNKSFGLAASDKMNYGICRVNVPKNHATGLIEATDNPREDSHKYFRMLSHKALSLDEFKAQAIAESKSQIPLLFVHGFNVPFEAAIYRAAQIAYDVKYQGPIMVFSWPAGAREGFLESKLVNKTYAANQEMELMQKSKIQGVRRDGALN